jgi:4-hydroxy-tetrahydrodipicolinate synthase
MSADRADFHGSLVALATPFRDGRIDGGAFVHLCERQIIGGTTGLVVCGSTGEAAAMSQEEQVELIALATGIVRGRIPVIAGCGGLSTEVAATAARFAARANADALLCAPTPYVKPSQEGIVAHIQRLADVSGLPIILYDVPGRTGVAIKDETVARLFERGLIVGIKDATADLSRPTTLKALCGPDLIQLSGDDATAAAYRAAGGQGCISVTANVVPAACAQLHRAWDEGDLATFALVRDALAPLHAALFTETNPVPLKAALYQLGLATDQVRLPLLPASGATHALLRRLTLSSMDMEDSLTREVEYVE